MDHGLLDSNRLVNFTKYCSYLKMFSKQYRKKSTVEENKKRMNIANFTNIYTNIYMYIPMSYVTRITQNKNDSINSTLQHGRVFDKVVV